MNFVWPKLKSNMILLLALLYSVVIISTIYNEASFGLMLVLLLWLYLFILAVNNIKRSIGLFCFLIAFFVFLLGREICFQYLSVEVYYKYLEKENAFTYVCLGVSLIGIFIGTNLKSVKNKRVSKIEENVSSQNIQRVTEYLFIFCYIFLMISVLAQIVLVRRIGYLASYTDEAVSNVPGFINYIAAFTPVIFCIFLATCPTKKRALLPMGMYEIYAVLTVFTGKRYPFIAISMLILIYMTIRNRSEKGWINKKLIYLLIISLPVLLVFMAAYDSIRIGEAFKFTNLKSTIIDFFDSQGGSVNVIKRVKYYENDLKDLFLTSFENTRTALFSNVIMRRLTGVTVYYGNSIERAMKGNSLMHRLSYYSYGNAYLAGRGVGSCYIAELYHDFGYLGILLGSVFYGWLIQKISNLKFSHYIRDGILLATMYYLLLAPRGNFDGFVGGIFSLYSILGIFTTYIIVKSVDQKQKRKRKRYSTTL